MANCFYIGYSKSQISVSLPANADGTCPPSPTSGYSGAYLVTFNAPADFYGVVLSPSEYQSVMNGNPFALTVAEANQIGASMALVLAGAWCFRALIRHLRDLSTTGDES